MTLIGSSIIRNINPSQHLFPIFALAAKSSSISLQPNSHTKDSTHMPHCSSFMLLLPYVHKELLHIFPHRVMESPVCPLKKFRKAFWQFRLNLYWKKRNNWFSSISLRSTGGMNFIQRSGMTVSQNSIVNKLLNF